MRAELRLVLRSMTAMTWPSRVTGIDSRRTGTPRVHSGSPSRQIRRSRWADSRKGRAPVGANVPTASSWNVVGPVVGRIWASTTQPEESCSGAHSTRSAKDRSASSCQSDTRACSQSMSADVSAVWRRARSFSVGTLPSSLIRAT